ncbi:Transketolase 2 [uncultured Clostridium sp.]|nr:Transketolase 2 [uncultured Clostridium sp.]
MNTLWERMGSVMGYDEKLIENEKLIEGLKKKAQKLRRDVIISMGVGVAGHIGGSNSSADIVAALYFYKMKHDPKNPKWKERDRFLLSKGHVGILQYAALAESGYFPVEDLKHTKEIGSYLQGHPDVQKTPGIEAGTGSLGQGLSIGLGMALGQRLDHLDSRTYVLVGDGEIAEGQIWEAAMAASAFKADNLTAIVDRNRLQANGKTKERFDTGDIMAKFLSFGWHVIEINGHDMREILGALDEAETVKGVPTAIIANTVKGKGVSFAENVVGYHNGMLTEETYRQALQELTGQEQEA